MYCSNAMIPAQAGILLVPINVSVRSQDIQLDRIYLRNAFEFQRPMARI